MLRTVDTASSKPGDLVLPLPVAQASSQTSSQTSSAVSDPVSQLPAIPHALIQELWLAAQGEHCDLTLQEFGALLASTGERLNHGLPSGSVPDSGQKAAFYRALHLSELALAHGCALGREVAWERFLRLYRASLTQAAIAIAGSTTLGHELADALYADLYGLRQVDGLRRSPLASYSGRGSLLGWLRATLAQRHINYYRRTHREAPLGDSDVAVDIAAPAVAPPAQPAELARISEAVALSLKSLVPEDRFLLSSWFLDRRTIFDIGRLLRVHESTISRRIKRVTADLRRQLLANLQVCGLSKRAAEEALGTDPRDVEINLRGLLQTSQVPAFPDQATSDQANSGRAGPEKTSPDKAPP